MLDEIDASKYSLGKYFEGSFEIENNLGIESLTIYQTDMKAISNYKLSDLIEIAKKNNVSVQINGKNKKKKDLYNEIMIKLIQ